MNGGIVSYHAMGVVVCEKNGWWEGGMAVFGFVTRCDFVLWVVGGDIFDIIFRRSMRINGKKCTIFALA